MFNQYVIDETSVPSRTQSMEDVTDEGIQDTNTHSPSTSMSPPD